MKTRTPYRLRYAAIGITLAFLSSLSASHAEQDLATAIPREIKVLDSFGNTRLIQDVEGESVDLSFRVQAPPDAQAGQTVFVTLKDQALGPDAEPFRVVVHEGIADFSNLPAGTYTVASDFPSLVFTDILVEESGAMAAASSAGAGATLGQAALGVGVVGLAATGIAVGVSQSSDSDDDDDDDSEEMSPVS